MSETEEKPNIAGEGKLNLRVRSQVRLLLAGS